MAINRWGGALACGLMVSIFMDCSAGAQEASARITNLRHMLADETADHVFVIAHRGCWKETSENSLAAIRACVDMGVDMVEIDVRPTRDGVLVLMHDDTIDRTTNGAGKLSDFTYEELKQFRLKEGKGGKDAALTQEQIPTFREAMESARGEVLVNFDAKADVYEDAFDVLKTTGTIDQIVMKKWMAPEDSPIGAVAPFNQVMAMPVLSEETAPDLDSFATQFSANPIAIEFIVSSLDFARQAGLKAQESQSRAWINTLADWLSAGRTDAQAMTDPDSVWGLYMDLGFTMI